MVSSYVARRLPKRQIMLQKKPDGDNTRSAVGDFRKEILDAAIVLLRLSKRHDRP